ncbi:hypothetical protein BROUX41_004654 [Berkeleyomyces rouxiae]|uniref:uncharacterized protein n=1 Tax=Berkeleyomyces rouxiae TaxID=2035830 RepID=UPI003B77F6E2
MTSPASHWQSTADQEAFREDGEMALKVQQMGLKVHYTFDKLEQARCLARPPQLIQVQTLPLDENTTVGLIDLNLCLSAVAQGSPELINTCTNPNSSIDYAVYVHDYSEPDAPLVGHGMLSGLMQNQNTASSPNPNMVTGIVVRNKLAMFGKGGSQTLEVKMKFSESQKMLKSASRQCSVLPSRPEVQTSIESVLTPAGNAEWAMLLQSNPQLATQMSHLSPAPTPQVTSIENPSLGQSASLAPSRIASPVSTAQMSRQCSFSGLATKQLSRQGTPIDNSGLPSQKAAVENIAPVGTAENRPPSRTSRKRGATGRPRGRPRKNPTPSESNGNTSGYEEGTDDDPLPKRRATTMAVTKTVNAPFASVPESLRVAASTSGSIRSFRPVGTPEPAAGGHLQDVPRAPTPVPFAEKIRPRISGSLRRTSTLNQEHSNNHLSVVQLDDARSPNELSAGAPTPNSEATTPDFGSSPPMPRTAQYLRHSSPTPSSPILPPMPPSTRDSGFMSGELEELQEDNKPTPRAAQRKIPSLMCRDTPVPVHVFHAASGEPVNYKSCGDSHNKRKRPNVSSSTAPTSAQPVVVAAGPPPPRSAYPPLRPKMPLSRLMPTHTPPMERTEAGPSQNSRTRAPSQLGALQHGTADTRSQPLVETTAAGSVPHQHQYDLLAIESRLLSQSPLEMDQQIQPEGKTQLSLEDTTMASNPVDVLSVLDLNFDYTTRPGMFDVSDESLLALGDAITFDKALVDMHAQQNQASAVNILDSLPLGQDLNASKEMGAQMAIPPRPVEQQDFNGEASQQQPTKVSNGSRPSKRKAPSPSASTPHPTSFSEAPCPPGDTLLLPLPAVAATSPPVGRTNKNYVRKQAIKEKLEQAIMNGGMPPFCANCGAIETPTWRKIFVQECTGKPVYHEYSDRPGRVTAIQVTSRDEEQNPTGYRMIKKALGPEDDKTQWKEDLLCNPCGIWLCKNNKHRPKDRWEKDAERLGQERRRRGTGRAPIRKRKTTSASYTNGNNYNYSVPASEANIMTDPLGPSDILSLIPEVQCTSELMDSKADTDNSTTQQPDNNAISVALQSLNNVPYALDMTHQSQPTTAAPTPENEDFSELGSMQRLLFPDMGSAVAIPANQDGTKASPHPVENATLNTDLTECVDGGIVPSIEGQVQSLLTSTQSALDTEIEALFGSPGRNANRPSTPPPKSGHPEFKTPSRPTPSHRPVTRSVSKSIRSAKSSRDNNTSPSDIPKTPSRTPRNSTINCIQAAESPSLRRSPRINKNASKHAPKAPAPGQRKVEASMKDIDAALAELKQSFDDTAPDCQQGDDSRALDSLGEQWSPNKDWGSIFDVGMLENLPQEDLDLLAKSLEASPEDLSV